jgi:hypothetical protein
MGSTIKAQTVGSFRASYIMQNSINSDSGPNYIVTTLTLGMMVSKQKQILDTCHHKYITIVTICVTQCRM